MYPLLAGIVLLGAMAGLRLGIGRFVVLVTLALPCLAVTLIVLGWSFGETALMLLASAFAVQLGYFPALVGRALRACVRTNDLLARWGGDEFVVLGTGSSTGVGSASAHDLNTRVNAALAADPGLSGRWRGTVTVGFADGPPDADVDRLIAQADADMYRRRGADTGR